MNLTDVPTHLFLVANQFYLWANIRIRMYARKIIIHVIAVL